MVPNNRNRRRSKGTLFLMLAVALTITIALVGWVLTVDWKVLKPSVKAKFGTVEESVPGVGLALREERIVTAPIPGKVEQYVSEGVRVPAGKVIASITNEAAVAALQAEQETLKRRQDDIIARNPFNKTNPTAGDGEVITVEGQLVQNRLSEIEKELLASEKQVSAVTAGIVSYYIDGLELPGPAASIKNLMTLDRALDTFPREPAEPTPTLSHRSVEMERPVCKIIDSLQFWLITDLPSGVSLSQGDLIRVRFKAEPNKLVEARVREVVAREGFVRAVLFFQDYQPFFSRLRWVDVQVVTAYYEGVVVPAEALRGPKGQHGVYVHGSGGVVYKPVRVIGGNQEEVVVDGLAEGSRVIL